MKKLISIVVLSVLLLGGIAGIGTAVAGDCCVAGDCPSGETCVGATAAVVADPTATPPVAAVAGCPGTQTGTCGGGAGSPNVLRESCTIKGNINWTEGEINGTPCVSPAPTECQLTEGDVVGPTGGTDVTHATEQWGMICLINSVNTITNWIFYLLMIIVVVMVVIGGATYMLSAGNPERAGKGKSIIIYGIVGLIIALLARLIPSLVRVIVGMG